MHDIAIDHLNALHALVTHRFYSPIRLLPPSPVLFRLCAYLRVTQQPRAADGAEFAIAPAPEGQLDLVGLFMRPRVPAMAALLAATWIALASHALGRLAAARRLRAIARAREQRRATARAGPDPVAHGPAAPPPAPTSSLPAPPRPPPPDAALGGRGTREMLHSLIGPPTPDRILREQRRDGDLRVQGRAIIGLLAGAAWPWLVGPSPLAALILAAAMLAGLVAAALRGTGTGRHRRRGGGMGFAAGWATLAVSALVATLMQSLLGASSGLAAVVALTMAALAAVSVQLRLGPSVGYGVAVIWGLIAIAAGSVGVNPAIATLAVLGIAAVAVALVRVTT